MITRLFHVKTYIEGYYCSTDREIDILKDPLNRKILRALRKNFPKGMTEQDLEENIGEGDIYRRLRSLEEKFFIKRLAKKRRGTGNKSSSVFIIEDASSVFYESSSFPLAPGNYRFSEDFKNGWKTIANREDEDLHNRLTHYVKKILIQANDLQDEETGNIDPDNSDEMLCPSCGFNHEGRDFIRSVILTFIDELETNAGFISLLKDQNFIKGELFDTMMKRSNSLRLAQKIKETTEPKAIPEGLQPKHLVTKGVRETIKLRVLCIQKDIVSGKVPFLAIDKDANLYHGDMDSGLVRDEIGSNTMIKCTTDHMDDNKETDLFIDVSINDSVEILEDDPAFRKISDFETKIEDLTTDHRPNLFVVNAVILEEPAPKQVENGDPEQEETDNYWTTIADETGTIDLNEINVEGVQFLNTLHQGEAVRIIGAYAYPTHLSLFARGVIEKTWGLNDQPINFLKLYGMPKIHPPRKNIVIRQEKFEGGIKVFLERIHLLNDATRLFLTIENTNEKDQISFNTLDSRLFQGKKQYEYAHYNDLTFRNIKTRMAPNVVEEGVLIFESLRSMEEPVKVHLQFSVATEPRDVVFSFDSIKI